MNRPWFALFVHDISNNYQLLLREDALGTARQFGHDVVVHSAEKSAGVQLSQIRAILAEPPQRRPAALLVSAVQEDALIGVGREALSKGVGWVFLCRSNDAVPQMQREFPKAPVFSVRGDQGAIGRLQGKQIRALLRPNDEIVYVQGPRGTSSAERRYVSARQELEGTSAKWSRLYGDWSVSGGGSALDEWLRGASRDVSRFVLACQSDDMAFGARRRLIDTAHLRGGQTPRILGCDGLPGFGQRMVADGQLSGTIVIPSVAGPAIRTFFTSLEQGRQPAAEVLLGVTSYPSLEALARKSPG